MVARDGRDQASSPAGSWRRLVGDGFDHDQGAGKAAKSPERLTFVIACCRGNSTLARFAGSISLSVPFSSHERLVSPLLRGATAVRDSFDMTVDAAYEFFSGDAQIRRSLGVIRQVGLGYIRLGQPATELSGGEAQRVKLATELQRAQRSGTIYVLDEPTTGLHPSDVEKLLVQLNGLVEGGSPVIVVEHDMHLVAASDWVIDIGPGAGEEGGRIVSVGTPADIAKDSKSRTAQHLADVM